MKRRNWLITGISSGLGQALALSVMESGDFVLGTMRRQSQVDAFNSGHIGQGKAYLLDVTDHDAIEQVVSSILRDYGSLDVLVNNAGAGFVGAVEEASMGEIRELFEANFFSALRLTQEVLPAMREQRSGHVVQISSHGGVKAFAGFGIYNASKFALEGFSEALAQEIAPLGIKLTLVEPGPFRTNFAGKGLRLAEKEITDYRETAGAFRSKLKGADGKQEGHPVKAAKAIIDMVNSDNPTLRLPLGKMAVVTMGIKVDSLASDIEANREVAVNAIYT
jgi:NAD(P)-dependent dehydrogenase (short-subunit alcohol dehydrogenase family)